MIQLDLFPTDCTCAASSRPATSGASTSLSIQPTLFGGWVLVREWGWIVGQAVGAMTTTVQPGRRSMRWLAWRGGSTVEVTSPPPAK